MQLVTFRVGRERYGLDIMAIQEIIIPEEITTLPNLPDFIEGIVNLRGSIFPIVDMRKRFKTADPDPAGRVLITEVEGSPIGLRVDGVDRVIRVDEESMRRPPAVLAGLGARFVRAVCETPRGLILMLDLGKLLDSGEVTALATSGVGVTADGRAG